MHLPAHRIDKSAAMYAEITIIADLIPVVFFSR
jgi:hypothetical protein